MAIEDRIGVVLTAFALVVSAVTATNLAIVDGGQARNLRANREFATRAPPTGKLAGQRALDNSEWVTPGEADGIVVLFAVDVTPQSGDVDFWRDIASRSRSAAPRVQFVGLCPAGQSCASPSDAEAALTFLTAMDPSQVHSVTAAAKRGQVLIYQGASVEMLAIKPDRQAFVTDISGISSRRPKEGV